MIRLLCNNLFHSRCFSTTNPSSHSFTLSYLINSCGLPPEIAITVSKKIEIQTPHKPNSVLTLLKTHGFTTPHISQLIQRLPYLLLSNPDKTLKPKLDFLLSLGLTGPDLAKMISSNPNVLHSSLANNIIPSIAFLKKIVTSDSNVVTILKRSKWILTKNVETYLSTKFDILRACGVPEANIVSLLVSFPNVFVMENYRFKKIVEDVKKMGFDPCRTMFCEGIRRLGPLKESMLEAKIDVYKSWGWSEEDIYRAFKKAPTCIGLSGGMINVKMDFLVKKMGFDALQIAKYPSILKYNLEKRIVPRCAVVDILISNGVIERSCNLNCVALVKDEDFVKKFVTRYEGKLPHLLKVYQRKMIGL